MIEPSAKFLALMRSPWKFKAFAMRKVPIAAYARIKVDGLDGATCRVSIPYSRRTTNPFRSTYFAALAAAGELSTGILAMAHLFDQREQIAMLMVDCSAQFVKKASDLTVFECTQGQQVAQVIKQALLDGEPHTFVMDTTGRNASGEIVATMQFTWSFKRRTQ